MELKIVLNPNNGNVGAVPVDADTESFLRQRVGQKIRVSKEDVKPEHKQYGLLHPSLSNYAQLSSEARILELTKIWVNGEGVNNKLILSSILIQIGHAEHTPITSPMDTTDVIAYVTVPKSLRSDKISQSDLALIIQDVINWMRDDLIAQNIAQTTMDAEKMLNGVEL